MREIKFRAWDNDNMCFSFFSFSDLEWLSGEVNSFESYFGKNYFGNKDPDTGNPLLMQFTGLHDKNGKEIYEGDTDKSGNVVEFVNGGFCLNGDRLIPISFEVAGNVYE